MTQSVSDAIQVLAEELKNAEAALAADADERKALKQVQQGFAANRGGDDCRGKN